MVSYTFKIQPGLLMNMPFAVPCFTLLSFALEYLRQGKKTVYPLNQLQDYIFFWKSPICSGISKSVSWDIKLMWGHEQLSGFLGIWQLLLTKDCPYLQPWEPSTLSFASFSIFDSQDLLSGSVSVIHVFWGFLCLYVCLFGWLADWVLCVCLLLIFISKHFFLINKRF